MIHYKGPQCMLSGGGELSLLSCGRPLVFLGQANMGCFFHIQPLVGMTSSAIDAVAIEFVVMLQDSWGVARYVVGLGLLVGGEGLRGQRSEL